MTKLLHEQLNLNDGRSPVRIKWCDYDHFKYSLHNHNEFEIVYIIESHGKRLVGNCIEPYNDGDLILIGSCLPHMHKSERCYYQNNQNLRVKAIVLHFSKDFFCHSIENYPEFHRIKKLLRDAQLGISFNDCEETDKIKKSIRKALKLKGMELLLAVIHILYLMSETENKIFLNDETYVTQLNTQNQDSRISKILLFLQNKYNEPINLNQIADRLGMNKTAFCRFFKEKTGKSCITYINELRINNACNLLKKEKLTIAQISYEVGFNNISNFNRQFRKIMKSTPSEFLHDFKKYNIQH